jgi:glycerophosphoryl diester phosphodiesterase
VVVFHDDDLRRLCGRGERIDGLTRAELDRVRLPGDRRIPGLDHVFETLGDQMLVNIELKAADRATLGRLAECIARHNARHRVLVSSFHPRLLAMARRRIASVPRGYLFHDRQPGPVRRGWPAHLLRVAAVHPQHTLLDPERIAAWKRRGYLVNTWTVNGDEEVRRVAALGVDGIITNDPAATLAALG